MAQVNSFRGGSSTTGSSISTDDIKSLKFYKNGTLVEEYNPLLPEETDVELSDGIVHITYDPNNPDSASIVRDKVGSALSDNSTPVLVVGGRFYPMVYASSSGYVFQLLVDDLVKTYTVHSGGVSYREFELGEGKLEIIEFSKNNPAGTYENIAQALVNGKNVILSEESGVLYLPDAPMFIVGDSYSFTACLYTTKNLTRTVDSFYIERLKIYSDDTIQQVPLHATTFVTSGLSGVPSEITGMYMTPFRANAKALNAQDGSHLGLLLDQSAASRGQGRGIFQPIGWYQGEGESEKLAYYTIIIRTESGQSPVSPMLINFNKTKRAGNTVSGDKYNATYLDLTWQGDNTEVTETYMLVPPNSNAYVANEPYVLTEKLVEGNCELEWQMLSNLIPHPQNIGIDIINLAITDPTPYDRIEQDLINGKVPIIRLGVDSQVYDQYVLANVGSSGYKFFSSSDNMAKWLTVTETEMSRTTIALNGGSGSSNIYEAVYGTTTFEEITTALNSGYTILCRKSDNYGNKYYGVLTAFRNSGKYVFLSGDETTQFRFEVGADNAWTTSAIATPVAQGTHSRALTIHPADIDSSHTMENTSNTNQWRGIGTILVPTGDVDLTDASCVISLDSGSGTSPTTFRVGVYEITDITTGSSRLVAQSNAMNSGLTVGINRIPITCVDGHTMLNGEGLYYVVLFTAGWGSITPFGKTTMNIGPLLTSWQYLWTFTNNELPSSFSPVSSWGYAYPFFAMIEA